MAEIDRLAIRAALLNGEVTWQQALEKLTASPKPWQTKTWKERRDALIRDGCQQCGSCQPPMVLQHLHQPRRFRLIWAELRQPLFEQYKAENPFVRSEPQPVDRQACPRCSSTAIRAQRRAEHLWKCYGKQRGRTCGHEFDTPAVVQALSPEQKHARSAEWQSHYEASREDFDRRFADEIGKQAVLLSIEEHLRYMTLEGTVTFCKRCAFLWDMKKMRLCGGCGERFHHLWLPLCATCGGEARPKENDVTSP